MIIQPVTMFLSYAHKDKSLCSKLEKHLSLLQRQGLVSSWKDQQIMAGTDWAQEINEHLKTASIILLLISSDFLASDYCYGVEMQGALQRHAIGQARVIPIIVRPVDWKSAPFAHLQVLPTSTQAVTSWSKRDEAWADVALGIRKTIEEFRNDEQKKETVPPPKKSIRPVPFPAVWNVPYRYTFFFTGRDRQVEDLFANFTLEHPSGIVPVQALSGLAGLGKTQTAVEYAYRYRQHYRAVLWVKRAETEDDLFAGFTDLAERLKRPIAHRQDAQSLRASMQEWFTNTPDWLLILDNADNLTLVKPYLPTSPLGHVLLTTRAIAMGGLAQPLALSPLTLDDGALCILRRANLVRSTDQLSDAPPARVKAAQELSQLMGGLPLALEQAGAYIETTGRSVSGYRDLYLEYRAEIQRDQHGEVPNYHNPVAFAWNIARETVQAENTAAIELLHLCAFLAPEAIPYDLFTESAHLLGSTLAPVAAKPVAFDQAIALLRKHSLIKNEVDQETDISRLIIHPVLQDILKDAMDSQTQHLLAQRVVNAVAHALPVITWQIIQAHARKCLSLIEQWQMSSSEADLIRQRFVASHR